MTEQEITILDLITEKFDHIKTELKTIKEDVQELKKNCKEGRAICAVELKDYDRRLDAVEAEALRACAVDKERDRDLERRLARRQIISNGISGILGAITAALIILFKGWL